MKVALCIALLVCLVGAAYSCTLAGDCTMTCAAGQHVACINSQCECHGDHENECKVKDDCHLHCEHHTHNHCIDGHCQCTWGL